MRPSSATELAKTAPLNLLGQVLASDLERSVRHALAAGAIFPNASTPRTILRNALAASIRDIEHHERGRLVQRFLLEGPHEDSGQIPPDKVGQRLSDAEVAATAGFIHSFMVNSFKGSLVELLACAPCVQLMRALEERGRLALGARLFVGDSVMAATSRTSRFSKGADLHILELEGSLNRVDAVEVAGIVEVKSYPASQRRIARQLGRQLQRAADGLRIGNQQLAPPRISLAPRAGNQPVRIAVVPSTWKLPRTFEIQERAHGHLVHSRSAEPPADRDRIHRVRDTEWRITLRWSHEAIASAAYAMTFWYMEKVGEVIYRDGVPGEWSEMTPAEAGRNAVKMMLYYSILRARTQAEEQRAIALYNTYGFGYALGMSFRNPAGRREMLWLRDLEELGSEAVTRTGCRLM